MSRSFTYLWTKGEFKSHQAKGPGGFLSAGCNHFRKRGVESGDSLYIISFFDGQLHLLGRFVVDILCSVTEAPRVMEDRDPGTTFDNYSWAADWVFADQERSSPMCFKLIVP